MAAYHVNLIKSFTSTDFKLKYQGSMLGYFWSLLNPILTFGIFYVVFTLFVRFEMPHYPIYLLLGVVLWSYFTEATQNSMNALVGKSRIIKNIYFPRTIIIIASNLTALLGFLLNLLVFFVFFFFSKIALSFHALLSIVYLSLLVVITLGFSYILAALNLRFPDVQHLWRIILQIMFWATPIVYPLSTVPENLQKFFLLNPFYVIIDGVRTSLIQGSPLVLQQLLLGLIYTAIVFFIGYSVYKKMSDNFPEWV